MANERPAAGGLRMSDQREEPGEPYVIFNQFWDFYFQRCCYCWKASDDARSLHLPLPPGLNSSWNIFNL